MLSVGRESFTLEGAAMIRDPHELVRQAFLLARAKRKPDWHRMSLAVLKNRLLDITDREFTESRYGATNFSEFVGKLSGLVTIDSTTYPPTIELIQDLASGTTEIIATSTDTAHVGGRPKTIYDGTRIRSDLWSAINDWKSGAVYVWDRKKQCAQKANDGELGDDVLPTMTKAEFDKLRADFVSETTIALNPPERSKLDAWKVHKMATTALPASVIPLWHTRLTRYVEARLQEWLEGDNESIEREFARYRENGDSLAVGELLARKFETGLDTNIDRLLANVIANWGSARPPANDLSSTQDIIAHIDSFTPVQLALAVVHAGARLKEAGIEPPSQIGDLAYRLMEPLRKVFDLPERVRKTELVNAATAAMNQAFSGLMEAVKGFQRTTAVTAKQSSIEVVKQAHRYARVALQGEVALIREIETVLGPVFRKFCECCERHDAGSVARRASELRQHIQRVQNSYREDSPYKLFTFVLSPVLSHVSSLIEEGMRATEEFTAPAVSVVGSTFKLDLSAIGRQITFPVRLRNDGQGTAYGLRLSVEASEPDMQLQLVEPNLPFDLMPASERLVSLGLSMLKETSALTIPVRWTCITSNGKTYEFRQALGIEQQNSQPNWDVLEATPPYAVNPIKEKDNLYGRDSVIADLRLHVLAGTSTFLWGQKRVGKTSVLQVLAAELASLTHVTCIYLRIGELAVLHEGQLAHTIAARLCEALDREADVPSEDWFGAGLGRLVPFVERLSKLLPKNRFLVIIDEFDELNASFYTGERGGQFVKALRSLSEVGLTLFFIGSERMDVIYQTHASVLNKWVNYSLDCIQSEEDCAALITRPVGGVIEFDALAVKGIVQYCGGNPFYLHLLCSQLFRRCVQERRTYIGDSDVDDVKRELLRVLGASNFAHFWDDNPELVFGDKKRQTAENCIYLACVASLGGFYESCEDLLEAQQTLQLSGSQSLTRNDFRTIEARLVRRKVMVSSKELGGGFLVGLPILKEWLLANAETQLLPFWRKYIDEQSNRDTVGEQAATTILETTPFPISEDDLLPVSQKLIFLGKQIDVAEVRRWLRQFDDDSRIEVAFQLLRRLAERGYVTEGAMVSGLARTQEALNERRTKLGSGAWQIIRRRLDNLCITFVDSDVKSGAQTARELAKRMQPGKCGPITDVYGWVRGHLESDPMVVVADDFSGTGDTLVKGIKRLWQQEPEMLASLANEGRIICCLQTAFPEALQQLKSEFASLQVLVMKPFDNDVRAFDPSADIFANAGELKFARDVMLQIGRQLTPQRPLGYGDLGVLIAFHNTIPNNTLPIFWSSGTVNNRPWIPLLPRASF